MGIIIRIAGIINMMDSNYLDLWVYCTIRLKNLFGNLFVPVFIGKKIYWGLYDLILRMRPNLLRSSGRPAELDGSFKSVLRAL